MRNLPEMSLIRFAISRVSFCRGFASSSPPLRTGTVGSYQVFDRHVKRTQKDQAATRDAGERSRTVDYVREEVADRMMERFIVCLSTSITRVLLYHDPTVGHKA